MTIDFDEQKHVYSCNGVTVPGVTDILFPLTGQKMNSINPAILQVAADRGRAVHEICEMLDYGMDDIEVPFGLEGYVKAYMDFLRDYKPEWRYIEKIVYALRDGEKDGSTPRFCGTVDRYGLIAGIPSVLDIKTIASPTAETYMAVCCQTYLYGKAIEKMTGTEHSKNLYALFLRKDGTYRLVDLWKWIEKSGFNAVGAAWTCLELWEMKQKVLDRKRRKGDAE